MKWINLVLVVCLAVALNAIAQEPLRVANDNVVVICGDTPSGGSKSEKSWKDPNDPKRPYDEFWNDTYLMWELAYVKGGFPERKAGASADHIHMLYGYGSDFISGSYRYRATDMHNIPQITDYSAYYGDVANIFNWLANGHDFGDWFIRQMTNYDELFTWTFDHGDSATVNGVYHVYLCLMGTNRMREDDFRNRVNQINHWRRVFWMQQCFSGGFIPYLKSNKTVITTAAKSNETAHPADDVSRNYSPLPENETYQSATYHHGEYNFHIMNSVRGCAIYPYENPPSVNANQDHVNGISMSEAWIYLRDHESQVETPQHSDLGNKGATTFLLFDPLSAPLAPTGLTASPYYQGGKTYVSLDWNDNEEIDLDEYNIYRRSRVGDGPWGQWGKIGSTTTSSYTDGPVQTHDKTGRPYTYAYYTTAYDVYGYESYPSNIDSVGPIWPRSAGGAQTADITGLGCDFVLYGSSPNPFRLTTTIRYAVPNETYLTLRVYDIAGRSLKTLYNGIATSGTHSITWNGEDDLGRRLENGVYFIRLEAENTVQKSKVLLISQNR